MIKHTKRMITGLAISASMLCAAPLVSAATDYDFTHDDWSGVTSGVETGGLHFEAVGGAITWNANSDGTDPNLSMAPCGVLGGYACDGDGLGIGDDEITGGTATTATQSLTVTFRGGPVRITELSFLDLFQEGAPLYIEIAYWNAAGGPAPISAALPAVLFTGTNGFGAIGVDIIASSITFSSLVDCPTDCTHFDFSLAGMKVEEVPIPAAAWLFGSGLIGLAGIARRRRAA